MVACSDARFHDEIDEFLHTQLSLSCCDRLYVPGGAGALATGGVGLLRARRLREECHFLIGAHKIRRAVLFFHGPAADGPVEAICGDYKRRQPKATAAEVRRQQEGDARQILRDGLGDGVRLEMYLCEVTKDSLVRFESIGV